MTAHSVVRRVGTFAVVAFVAAAPAYAQKTFNQSHALVGGVTPGDAPGFPVVLSVRGHYKLTGHLAPPNRCGSHAIEVTASFVTIDLNGFTIVGPGTDCSDGIRSLALHTVVLNGTVRNFATGINLAVNSSAESHELHRIERVKVYGNTNVGLAVGNASMVLDSLAEGSASGMVTGKSALLLRNTAFHNQRGIVAGAFSNLLQNTLRENSIVGLELADATVGYGDNVLVNNGSGGPQVTSGTQLTPNVCGGSICH